MRAEKWRSGPVATEAASTPNTTETTVTQAELDRTKVIVHRLRGPVPPRPVRPRFSWPRDRDDRPGARSEPIDWAEMTGQFVSTKDGVKFMSLARSRRWVA